MRLKPHRRKANRLNYEQRWEVAYLFFFKDVAPKDLAYKFNISLSYVHRIKIEFIDVLEIWKESKAPPEQLNLGFKRLHRVRPHYRRFR